MTPLMLSQLAGARQPGVWIIGIAERVTPTRTQESDEERKSPQEETPPRMRGGGRLGLGGEQPRRKGKVE